MKIPFFLLLVISILSASRVNAQGTSDTEEGYIIQYEANILLEEINGIYIPIDINDAMKQLDRLSSEEARKKMLEANEKLVADRLYFGLGKWMLVKWNLYEGSRISHVLKGLGVTDPDDMAKFLIISYHRHLRNADLEIDKRAGEIHELRKKEQEERNKNRKKIN